MPATQETWKREERGRAEKRREEEEKRREEKRGEEKRREETITGAKRGGLIKLYSTPDLGGPRDSANDKKHKRGNIGQTQTNRLTSRHWEEEAWHPLAAKRRTHAGSPKNEDP